MIEFFKLFVSLTADENLEYTDIDVMTVLVTFAQWSTDKTTELSHNDIHEIFKRMPVRTIRRALKRLEELHYIECIKQPPKKSKYRILIDTPKGQPKQIHRTNKIQSEGDYIEEVKRAALANPFLNGDDK